MAHHSRAPREEAVSSLPLLGWRHAASPSTAHRNDRVRRLFKQPPASSPRGGNRLVAKGNEPDLPSFHVSYTCTSTQVEVQQFCMPGCFNGHMSAREVCGFTILGGIAVKNLCYCWISAASLQV